MFAYLSVCEDTPDLFEFYTVAELNCSKMFTSVGGVDVKVGVSVLSELFPEQVALTTASGDSKALPRISDVDPKFT